MSPLRTRAKVSNPPSRHFGETRKKKRYCAETVACARSSRTPPRGGQNAWRPICMGEWQSVVLTSSTWHLIYFKLKCPEDITEKEKRLNIQKKTIGRSVADKRYSKKHSNVLRPPQLLSYKHKLQNTIKKKPTEVQHYLRLKNLPWAHRFWSWVWWSCYSNPFFHIRARHSFRHLKFSGRLV